MPSRSEQATLGELLGRPELEPAAPAPTVDRHEALQLFVPVAAPMAGQMTMPDEGDHDGR
jgi:hypothetical protein